MKQKILVSLQRQPKMHGTGALSTNLQVAVAFEKAYPILIDRNPELGKVYHGYAHGRSKQTRGLPRQELVRRSDAWVQCVGSFLLGVKVCAQCGTPLPLRSDGSDLADCSYSRVFCSSKCSILNPRFLVKRNTTCVERYGKSHDQVVKDHVILNAAKRTPEGEIQRSRKWSESILSHFGSLEAYGQHILKRRKTTNLKRYGVVNVMHSPVIFQRSLNFKVRTTAIQGKLFQYQGYELAPLKYLVSKFGVTRVHSWRKDTPGFSYVWDNKPAVYFPDLRVERAKDCVIVEVKSSYTAGVLENSPKDTWRRLIAKAKAVDRAGYTFVLACVSRAKKEDKVVWLGWPFTKEQVTSAFNRYKSLKAAA